MCFIGFISHESSIRVQRELYGISKTSFFKRINKFVDAINLIVYKYIYLPRPDEFGELNEGFAKYGSNNVILLMDGCHIKISGTPEKEYRNRKGVFSVNWLFLTDYKYRFRFASSSFGSAHNKRLFWNAGDLPDWIAALENLEVLADGAFVGIPNVRTILSRPEPNERVLNNRLKSIRVNVENTFGMFKNKFRKFLNRFINGNTDVNLKKTTVAIVIWNLIQDNK